MGHRGTKSTLANRKLFISVLSFLSPRPLRRLLDRYYKGGESGDVKAELGPIEVEDVEEALKCCKSTGHGFKKEYEEFTKEYGS